MSKMKKAKDKVVEIADKAGEKTVKKIRSDKSTDLYTRFVRKTFLVLVLAILFAAIVIFIFFKIWSKGDDLTKVPSVIDMDIIEAAMYLEEAGLVLEVDTKFDDEVERFTVSDQYPKQGVTVREGRSVLLIVSMGRDIYEVPDIEGMDWNEAEILLSDLNIPYEETIIQSSSFVTNTVISIDKEPGEEIDRSEKLQIVVNSDLKWNEFRVDDYASKSVDYVVEALYDDGVIPVLVMQGTENEDEDGVILAQEPAAEEVVAKNSDITLTVGVYGEDDLERENTAYHVFRYYVPAKSTFTAGMTESEIEEIASAHVVVQVTDGLGEESEVYAAYVDYGQTITVVFKSYGYTTLDLVVNDEFIKRTTY